MREPGKSVLISSRVVGSGHNVSLSDVGRGNRHDVGRGGNGNHSGDWGDIVAVVMMCVRHRMGRMDGVVSIELISVDSGLNDDLGWHRIKSVIL